MDGALACSLAGRCAAMEGRCSALVLLFGTVSVPASHCNLSSLPTVALGLLVGRLKRAPMG
eukprot:11222702-Lingulodinium_polyedra.AAC.1